MRFWLVTVLVVLSSFLPSAVAAEGNETTKDMSSELRTLIKEVRALRAQVEQLEIRMALLEDERPSPLFRRPPMAEIDQQIRVVFPKRPKHDLGLYVFPGLDAPPLSKAWRSTERHQ